MKRLGTAVLLAFGSVIGVHAAMSLPDLTPQLPDPEPARIVTVVVQEVPMSVCSPVYKKTFIYARSGNAQTGTSLYAGYFAAEMGVDPKGTAIDQLTYGKLAVNSRVDLLFEGNIPNDPATRLMRKTMKMKARQMGPRWKKAVRKYCACLRKTQGKFIRQGMAYASKTAKDAQHREWGGIVVSSKKEGRTTRYPTRAPASETGYGQRVNPLEGVPIEELSRVFPPRPGQTRREYVYGAILQGRRQTMPREWDPGVEVFTGLWHTHPWYHTETGSSAGIFPSGHDQQASEDPEDEFIFTLSPTGTGYVIAKPYRSGGWPTSSGYFAETAWIVCRAK